MGIINTYLSPGNIESPGNRHSERHMRVRTSCALHESDYRFRPRKLERFPLYFLMSGCEAVSSLGPCSMDWVTLPKTKSCLGTPGSAQGDIFMGDSEQASSRSFHMEDVERQSSYDPEPLKSKSFPCMPFT